MVSQTVVQASIVDDTFNMGGFVIDSIASVSEQAFRSVIDQTTSMPRRQLKPRFSY